MKETQDTRVPFLARKDSPGGGNRNPLQYSCLENPMDREAWWAFVHGVRVRPDYAHTQACTSRPKCTQITHRTIGKYERN